jgi:hypothetical protein
LEKKKKMKKRKNTAAKQSSGHRAGVAEFSREIWRQGASY